jgi:hypothetical protein
MGEVVGYDGGMAPEIEAATALLESWDGDLEELAWTAELLGTIALDDPRAVSSLAALAKKVCARAGDAPEVEKLQRALEIAARLS